MSIQSTINQGLSLVSVLASQSPGLRALSEKRAKVRDLAGRESAIREAITTTQATGDIAGAEPYGEELADIKKQQFELDPTAENYKAYRETKPQRVAETAADPEEVIQETYEKEKEARYIRGRIDAMHEADRRAQEALQAAQETKRNTRRKFTDYMADEPTSLGGLFSDLDPKLQRAIAAQYTKSDRAKIMNRKDAENGKK